MRGQEKEPMSLLQSYHLRYTLNGAFWLLYGFIKLLPDSLMQKIIAAGVLLIAVICSSYSLCVKTEIKDEMAEIHLAKAKASTLDAMLIIFLFAMILFIVLNKQVITVKNLLPFMIGGVQFLTGALFWLYEKAGD